MTLTMYVPRGQFEEYKRRLKQQLLWCIFYREKEFEKGENSDTLETYFQTLLDRMQAMNELLSHPSELLGVIELLEAAKELYDNDVELGYNFPTVHYLRYRKYILDARALVDAIPYPSVESDGDDDADDDCE